MKKWNTTIRYAGFSLIGVALLMFISAFIAFRNGMDDSFNPLVFSGMVALLSGFFAIITTKPQEKMTVEDGFRIVTGCWVAACVLGDDTDAAHPSCGDAPKLHAVGQGLDVVEDGGSRGGEARNTLEEGVDHGELATIN